MLQLSTGCLCIKNFLLGPPQFASVHLLQLCGMVRMASFAANRWKQDDGAECRLAKPGSPSLSLTAYLTKPEMSAAPLASALIVCAAGNAELPLCEGHSH